MKKSNSPLIVLPTPEETKKYGRQWPVSLLIGFCTSIVVFGFYSKVEQIEEAQSAVNVPKLEELLRNANSTGTENTKLLADAIRKSAQNQEKAFQLNASLVREAIRALSNTQDEDPILPLNARLQLLKLHLLESIDWVRFGPEKLQSVSKFLDQWIRSETNPPANGTASWRPRSERLMSVKYEMLKKLFPGRTNTTTDDPEFNRVEQSLLQIINDFRKIDEDPRNYGMPRSTGERPGTDSRDRPGNRPGTSRPGIGRPPGG